MTSKSGLSCSRRSKVSPTPLKASCSIPGLTPRKTMSHCLKTSSLLWVTLAPSSCQCVRFSKWGPDTQIFEAGWVSAFKNYICNIFLVTKLIWAVDKCVEMLYVNSNENLNYKRLIKKYMGHEAVKAKNSQVSMYIIMICDKK